MTDTWWNGDKSKRLTIHKCGSCGQKNVVGWQKHWVTEAGGPEGIRSQYGNWRWIAGGYGEVHKILLCDSCLHLEERIVQDQTLAKTIDVKLEILRQIHETVGSVLQRY